MTKRRDNRTGNLFDYARGNEPIQRFEENVTAAATLTGRLCRAMKQALADCPMTRGEIATRMSAYLGHKVSKAMLDKYVSEGSQEHEITVTRFLALVHATSDFRLLNLLTEPFGYISTPRENEGWIRAGQLVEREEAIKAQLDATQEERKLQMRMARTVRR